MTVEEAQAEASAACRACEAQHGSAGDAAALTERAWFWQAEVDRLRAGHAS
jgi:hypothetical protein